MPSSPAIETVATGSNERSSSGHIHDRSERWWNVVCIALAVSLIGFTIWPIVDAGRAALDLNWIPGGDWAVLNLRVEDVGRNTPLVGPYSRFGWNHPGPMMFWILSIPYRLFGNSPDALLAAAATFNALTVTAIGAVAWRRGRLPLIALTMALLAISFRAMGPTLLRDPWNPFITLLPLALLVFLAWSLVEGDTWMWPAFLFVASFLLQSHIGYLPMTAMVTASVVVVAWRGTSFGSLLPSTRKKRRWVIGVSTVVLIFCWFPVLIDQFFESGNLGAIATYFANPSDKPAGFATALTTAADQLRLPSAPWLGAKEFTGTDGALLGSEVAWLLLPLGAMAGAGWLAIRRGASSALRFQLIVSATVLGGVIATARVIGPLFDWVVRWWWILAVLWWLSILWSVWSALCTRVRRDSQRNIATVFVAISSAFIVFLAVQPVVGAVMTTVPPSPSIGMVLREFLEPTLESLDGSGPLLVRTVGSVRGDYGDAIRLQLERSGIQVVSEPATTHHLGPARSEARRTPEATLWIVSADAIAEFQDDPSMTELGRWDPLSEEERTAFTIDKVELQNQLIAAGRSDLAEALTNGAGGVDTEGFGLLGVDQQLLQRVESVRRRGDPVAIFLGPPPTR